MFEAAKLANADEFVRSFPDGYRTVVGEKGHSVSGGQKQRCVMLAFMYDVCVCVCARAHACDSVHAFIIMCVYACVTVLLCLFGACLLYSSIEGCKSFNHLAKQSPFLVICTYTPWGIGSLTVSPTPGGGFPSVNVTRPCVYM